MCNGNGGERINQCVTNLSYFAGVFIRPFPAWRQIRFVAAAAGLARHVLRDIDNVEPPFTEEFPHVDRWGGNATLYVHTRLVSVAQGESGRC